MKNIRIPTISLFALALPLFLLFIAGCQTSRPSNEQLLRQEYSQMTDNELLAYYQQLNDRIAGRDSGGSRFGFGLGLGMGFGLNGGAVGLGASKGVGGSDPVDALKVKRNQVRLEIARRGLEPLPQDDP